MMQPGRYASLLFPSALRQHEAGAFSVDRKTSLLYLFGGAFLAPCLAPADELRHAPHRAEATPCTRTVKYHNDESDQHRSQHQAVKAKVCGWRGEYELSRLQK